MLGNTRPSANPLTTRPLISNATELGKFNTKEGPMHRIERPWTSVKIRIFFFQERHFLTA